MLILLSEKNTLNNKQYELEKENVMLHKNINDLKINNQELLNRLQTSQKNISDIHRHQQGCQNCLKNDHLIKVYHISKYCETSPL